MKVLFVADLHYSLRQYDWLAARAADFDAVWIGGDLLDLAAAPAIDTQIVVIEKYLERIASRTRLCVCSGNHDGDARDDASESVCRWLREVKHESLSADGDSVSFGEARISVCPWWDGERGRGEVEQLLEGDSTRRGNPWIWIHHAPPAGSPVCWTGRSAAGDEVLAGWIRKFQPDLVLSGHIHNAPFYADGSWIDRIGQTWVFNCGRQIGPEPTHVVLDLDAMTASWFSLEEACTRHLA